MDFLLYFFSAYAQVVATLIALTAIFVQQMRSALEKQILSTADSATQQLDKIIAYIERQSTSTHLDPHALAYGQHQGYWQSTRRQLTAAHRFSDHVKALNILQSLMQNEKDDPKGIFIVIFQTCKDLMDRRNRILYEYIALFACGLAIVFMALFSTVLQRFLTSFDALMLAGILTELGLAYLSWLGWFTYRALRDPT